MGEFSDKVFEIVRQVPSGKVTTYGQIEAHLWDGRGAGEAAADAPQGPPEDFDWEAELGE